MTERTDKGFLKHPEPEYFVRALKKAGVDKHPEPRHSLEQYKFHGHDKDGNHSVSTHYTNWAGAPGKRKVSLNHTVEAGTGKVIASDHPNFKSVKEEYVNVAGQEATQQKRDKKRARLAKKATVVAEAFKIKTSGGSAIKSLQNRQKQQTVQFKTKLAREKIQAKIADMQNKSRSQLSKLSTKR